MNGKARGQAAMFVLGKLSDREIDVFKRLAQGESITTISTALGLAHSTVCTYRRRVLTKLHQHSNTDLALIAQRLGIVHAPDL